MDQQQQAAASSMADIRKALRSMAATLESAQSLTYKSFVPNQLDASAAPASSVVAPKRENGQKGAAVVPALAFPRVQQRKRPANTTQQQTTASNLQQQARSRVGGPPPVARAIGGSRTFPAPPPPKNTAAIAAALQGTDFASRKLKDTPLKSTMVLRLEEELEHCTFKPKVNASHPPSQGKPIFERLYKAPPQKFQRKPEPSGTFATSASTDDPSAAQQAPASSSSPAALQGSEKSKKATKQPAAVGQNNIWSRLYKQAEAKKKNPAVTAAAGETSTRLDRLRQQEQAVATKLDRVRGGGGGGTAAATAATAVATPQKQAATKQRAKSKSTSPNPSDPTESKPARPLPSSSPANKGPKEAGASKKNSRDEKEACTATDDDDTTEQTDNGMLLTPNGTWRRANPLGRVGSNIGVPPASPTNQNDDDDASAPAASSEEEKRAEEGAEVAASADAAAVATTASESLSSGGDGPPSDGMSTNVQSRSPQSTQPSNPTPPPQMCSDEGEQAHREEPQPAANKTPVVARLNFDKLHPNRGN